MGKRRKAALQAARGDSPAVPNDKQAAGQPPRRGQPIGQPVQRGPTRPRPLQPPSLPDAPMPSTPSLLAVALRATTLVVSVVINVMLPLAWVCSGIYVLNDAWRSGQNTQFTNFGVPDAWIALFALLSVSAGGSAMVAGTAVATCLQLDPEHSSQIIREVACGIGGGLCLFGGSVIWAKSPSSSFTTTLLYRWCLASFAFTGAAFLYTLIPLLLIIRRHGTLYKKTWVSAANREPLHRPINFSGESKGEDDDLSDYVNGFNPRTGRYSREEEDALYGGNDWADDNSSNSDSSSNNSDSTSADPAFFSAFSGRKGQLQQYEFNANSQQQQQQQQQQSNQGGVLAVFTQPLSYLLGDGSARPAAEVQMGDQEQALMSPIDDARLDTSAALAQGPSINYPLPLLQQRQLQSRPLPQQQQQQQQRQTQPLLQPLPQLPLQQTQLPQAPQLQQQTPQQQHQQQSPALLSPPPPNPKRQLVRRAPPAP